MKKKTKILLIVLAIILVLAAAAAVIVLRMNRGSRTPIDNNPEPAVSGNKQCAGRVFLVVGAWSADGELGGGGDRRRAVPHRARGALWR